MSITDKLLKQMKHQEFVAPIATVGNADFILPNRSGTPDKLRMAGCFWSCDGADVFLKKDDDTTILTINLTTGNLTLGGTQKRVICTKVIGA